MEGSPPSRRSGETGHLPGIHPGGVGCPQAPGPPLHDLYFSPQVEEFAPRTTWSLSHAFTSAFEELDPIRQFKATAKPGPFLELASAGVN